MLTYSYSVLHCPSQKQSCVQGKFDFKHLHQPEQSDLLLQRLSSRHAFAACGSNVQSGTQFPSERVVVLWYSVANLRFSNIP